jgi:hypothetical protein
MINWPRAIERNRDALRRIVAMLFVMAGLADGEMAAVLPRHLRNHVMRILRPAEAAFRRLVIIAARDLVVEILRSASPANGQPGGAGAKPCPTGWVVIGPPSNPAADPERASAKAATAIPAFPLLDPLKRFDFQRRRYAGTIPRVRSLSCDWSVPVYLRRPETPARPVPTPGDPVDATGLCRRLISLKRALDDLDGQARRLAHWKAKRDLGLNRSPRFNPMRPGRPPGHRKRAFHEVDDVLRECHSLVLDAGRGDTS